MISTRFLGPGNIESDQKNCTGPNFKELETSLDIKISQFIDLGVTKKYLLRGYILGELKHTTALDRVWGGGKTLK